MSDQKISVFDIYEYLPQTSCKNCGENNCMAFAEKLLQGKKTIGACSALRIAINEENRQEIQKLMDKNKD
jgi:ArsR family metal-binding transcriptional regulator